MASEIHRQISPEEEIGVLVLPEQEILDPVSDSASDIGDVTLALSIQRQSAK